MCQGETVPDVAGSRTRTISLANPTLRSVRREKFPASENSPNERLGNVRLHQSALAPENFTTMPHFSISCPTSFPKPADEPGITVLAKSAKRAFILGSARPALISLLSLPTISLGVFFGAAMPYQAVAS